MLNAPEVHKITFPPNIEQFARDADKKVRPTIKRMPNKHAWTLLAIRHMMGELCKTYLEIGVLHGGSMSMVAQSHYPTTLCGIDLFAPNLHYKRGDAPTVKRTMGAVKENNSYDYKVMLFR